MKHVLIKTTYPMYISNTKNVYIQHKVHDVKSVFLSVTYSKCTRSPMSH